MTTLNRRYELTSPFQYKGNVIRAILYYDGNSDLVHSWDVTVGTFNISKAARYERLQRGFTDADLEALNRHVAGMVNAKEGRRLV